MSLYDSFDKNLYAITPTDPVSTNSTISMLSAASGGGASANEIEASQIASSPTVATQTQTTGTLKQGKTGFDNTVAGYILGFDPTTGYAKFYIGNTTSYLNWTGQALNIAGTITATTGTIGPWTISATALSTGAFNTNGTMYFGTSGLSLSNTFNVTSGGVLTATSGTIGGFTITSNTLYGSTIKTAATVGVGSTGVIMDTTGLRGYDSVLGNTFNLPVDGSAPTFSSGAIQKTVFTVNTGAAIETSSTVGDGTANSAGILMNNTGFYACQANQTLANANIKILVDGSGKFISNISGGQTDYNTGIGYFLGLSGGLYKFSVGDPAGSNMTWDGTYLRIRGSFDVGTGGIINNAVYTIATLPTAPTSIGFNVPSSFDTPTSTVNTLVVAGGGAGGGGSFNGGGGGAGGYQANTSFSVTQQAYSITVGTGGAGHNDSSVNGDNGTNSVFSTITATGGGGGGVGPNNAGRAGSNGGSGGGAGGSGTGSGGSLLGGTGSQGSNGGNRASGDNAAAGGGGNSAVGSNSTASNGGNGGNGTANSISGSSVTYAGGGGGATGNGTGSVGTGGTGGGGSGGRTSGSRIPSTAGTANTGGGGGGDDQATGSSGGSGVVIIAFPTNDSTGVSTASTGGTITTVGGNQIHTFTTSGTFTCVTGFTNPANIYASDDTYATLAATSGDLTVEISKDGGVNYGTSLVKTFTGSDTLLTYGNGSTELWGYSFTRADMVDSNFRIRLSQGSTKQVYKNFGFATGTETLTGIEVAIEGNYNASVLSLDLLKIKIYYGTSILPVQQGSMAYASDQGMGSLQLNNGVSWVPVVPDIVQSILSPTVDEIITPGYSGYVDDYEIASGKILDIGLLSCFEIG